jgi:tocopherol O-methyltransferase
VIVPNTAWQPASVAHHYDELDPFYRELWGEHLHHGLWRTGKETVQEATVQLVAAVAERAQIQPGASVCDVGCGYGGAARLLAHRYGAYVIGLTVSPAQHSYAQAQSVSAGAPIPIYLLQDWLENTLPAQLFDAVIAIESTEHMKDKAGCFAQAYRVLRPGGQLVVCAWLASEEARPWAVRHLLEPICREGRLAGLYTMSENVQFIQEAGFQIECAEDVSAQVCRTWTVILRRMARLLATRGYAWRYLLDPQRRERIFAWTVPRLWLAYRLGALRYGILSARRGEDREAL